MWKDGHVSIDHSADSGATWTGKKVVTSADLDNRFVAGKGWTAIQTELTDVVYRLQIDPNGRLHMYKSTDAGANWTGKTIFSFDAT